jgi:hypothetical protein
MELLKSLITEATYFKSIGDYNFWIEDYEVTAEDGASVDFKCMVCFANRHDNDDSGVFTVEFVGNFSYDQDGATIGKPDIESMKVTPFEDPNEKGLTHLMSKGIKPEQFQPVLVSLVTNLVHTFADKNPYKFKDLDDEISAASHVDSQIDDMRMRDRTDF